MSMNRFALFAFALVGICFGCSSSNEPAASQSTPKTPPDASSGSTTVTYSDVQAIFDKNCLGCHGTDQPKEGYSFVSHESLMKGGEDGPAVTAGDPANSLLIQVLRGANGKKQMPFGGQPLPEEDIKKVEAWIQAGAKA